MSTKTDPVATATAAFPFPELTTIAEIGKPPTYATLQNAQSQLNANASAVDTTLGTGEHGHIVLTLSTTAFYTLTDTDEEEEHPHPAPPNPGNINPAATRAQARQHEVNLYHYKLHITTEKLLKKQLLAAIPDLYINTLKHPTTNYANVTTLALLTHLWQSYGTVNEAALDANLIAMAVPWHPTTPIEQLFKQLADGIIIAEAGECPMHDKHVIRIGYNIIFKTGLFEPYCHEWRGRASADKNFATFQTFFAAANLDRATSTGDVGFHSTNAITNDNNIIALQKSNKELIAKLNKLNNMYNPPTKPKYTDKLRYEGYCHTHGTTHAPTAAKLHNSITCKNPGTNHNKLATKDNKMGGNERVWGPPANKNM